MENTQHLDANYQALLATCSDFKNKINELERQRDALVAENAVLKEIFESVTNLDNEPEYHEQGMGCGLEDRNIHDRYEAMRHGWDAAMERVYGEVIPCAEEISFPATDAALREIGAKAVEKLICWATAGSVHTELTIEELEDFAQQLREGKA